MLPAGLLQLHQLCWAEGTNTMVLALTFLIFCHHFSNCRSLSPWKHVEILGITGTRFRAVCMSTALLWPFPNIKASLIHKPLSILKFPYIKSHRLSGLARCTHLCVTAQVCLVSGLCSEILPVLIEAFAAHAICWADSVAHRLQWLRSTEWKRLPNPQGVGSKAFC